MACEISKLVEQLQAKAEKGLVNGLPLDVAVIRLKAAYGKQQVAKVTKKADKAVARAQEKYEAALGTKIERTGTVVKEKIEHNGVTFIPTESEKYNDRTLINASADATIAFAVDFTTAGEKLTKRYVGELGRLYIPVDATKDVTDQAVDNIVDQLNKIEAKSLNIAGNGLYTFKGKTQEEVDTKMLELLSKITSHPKLKKPIALIKSGAQTGADEAGIKAAQKLGIRVESAVPGNWMFKDGKGNTITDKNGFLSRFGAVSNSSTFEVSTKGDSLGKKFSALNAKLKDGRTIEQAWAEAKGYKTIKEAKGKSAKIKGFKYREVYFGLWEQWAEENPDLVKELAEKTEGMTLVDSFAKTENNQANALTQIVENYRKGEGVTSENGMLKVQTFDKANPVMVFADGKTSKVFNSIDELTDFAFEYNSIMGKAGKIAVPQDQRMIGQIFSMLKNANIPFKPIRVELAKGKDEAGTERGLYEVKGHRITMFYNNKHTGANPAQVVLHEYVHAITLDHLDKNIELKKKVRALMDHVAKENANLTTWYAMKDEKEFLAEAIAEPKFREALAAIKPMNKRSVLQYVKDLFEELLNSLTNASIKEANAFTEALELVVEVANVGEAPFDTAKVVQVDESNDQVDNRELSSKPSNKSTNLPHKVEVIEDDHKITFVGPRMVTYKLYSKDTDVKYPKGLRRAIGKIVEFALFEPDPKDTRERLTAIKELIDSVGSVVDDKKLEELFAGVVTHVEAGSIVKTKINYVKNVSQELLSREEWAALATKLFDHQKQLNSILQDIAEYASTNYDMRHTVMVEGYYDSRAGKDIDNYEVDVPKHSIKPSNTNRQQPDIEIRTASAFYKETIPTKGKVQLSSDIIEAAKNCK